MKCTTLFLLFITVITFCSKKSVAQAGWKWGVTTGAPASSADIAGPTVVDKFGNVFLAAVQDGADSIKFGTHKVYDPTETNQCIVAKADTAGNFIWAVGLQCKGNAEPYSITTDSHGNLYLYGYYAYDSCKIGAFMLRRSSFWNMDFIAKFSPTGTVLWAENVSYAGASGGTIGTDDSDYLYIQGSFQETTDTIGITVLTNRDKPVFGYTSDIYLAKFDTSGNNLWAVDYGGKYADYPVPNASFLCSPMAVGPAGNSYITGASVSDTMYIGSTMLVAGPADVASSNKISYLANIDNNGNTVWAEKISNHISINGISTDLQGNIYVTGQIDSIVTIGATTLTWSLGWDYFMAKYDPNGNALWAKSAGGTDKEQGYAISVDHCGKLWVCGQTGAHESITLDGHILTPQAGVTDPIFIVEYDTAGNYLTGMMMPSGGDDMCGLVVDGRGNFFLGGDYEGEAMPFGPDTLALITGGEYFFMAKYKYDSGNCYTYTEDGNPIALGTPTIAAQMQGITIYPNPVTNELNISIAPGLSKGEGIRQVTINNLVGQTVYSKTSPDGSKGEETIRVNVANLPNGMYLVRINGNEVRKFVKE